MNIGLDREAARELLGGSAWRDRDQEDHPPVREEGAQKPGGLMDWLIDCLLDCLLDS